MERIDIKSPVITRREATAGLSAGLGALLVSFSLDPTGASAQTPPPAAKPPLPGSLNDNRMLDAWIRIDAAGDATVNSGKVELGQGILTALRQIAAEELDLPLDRITMISGDTGRTPNEGVTSGSQSIEFGGVAIRLAGAEVRALLLDLAAKRLGAPVEGLSVKDGVIASADGRSVRYGDLVTELDLKHEVNAKLPVKKPTTHKTVGQSIPRYDIPNKVAGGVAYVQDMRLPGMVHGRVVRPSRYGAKLEGFDEAAIKAMPGVLAVVRDGSFLGVIAAREEQAINASVALAKNAKWSGGTVLPDPAKLYDTILAMPTTDTVVSDKKAAVPEGMTIFEATYHKPYMAHASIGPSCAVAAFADGKMTVWTHSQGVFPLRGHLSLGLKMQPADVRCIHVEGSGCYGHNGADDVALDAALLARAVPGKPVRLQWMRADEFAWEPYGPAMVMKAKAALKDGRIVDWSYDLWSPTHSTRPSEPGGNNLLASWYLAEPQKPAPPRTIAQPSGGGDRNAVPLYDFPSQKVTNHFITEMPVRVSALRTLGAYANVFAIESFIDELALAAGADPLAFRLAHMKEARARAVIEAVARKAGWAAGQKSDGARGLGLAFAKYKNLSAYVAVVAEVTVDRVTGMVRVPRAWAAVDAGQIINPDGLVNQIEGGIIQSASWTLKEAVAFTRDGITVRDWSAYPILTIPEAPKVEVELINRPDEKSLGAGEGSQGPAVAAIANAFAHATGKRLRDLPFTPDRVKAVLA